MASSVISGGGVWEVGGGGGKGRGSFQRRNGTNFNNVLFPWKGNILLNRNVWEGDEIFKTIPSSPRIN